MFETPKYKQYIIILKQSAVIVPKQKGAPTNNIIIQLSVTIQNICKTWSGVVGDTHWLAAAHNISGGTQRLATVHNRWHGWSTAAWQWSTVQQTAHSATATSRGFWCHAILVAARHWSGGNKATVDIILCHSFLSGGQLFAALHTLVSGLSRVPQTWNESKYKIQ